MKKIFKVLKMFFISLFILLCTLSLAAFLFLTFWKPFGGSASERDRLNYAERAANFDGKEFHNLEDFKLMAFASNPSPDPLTFSDRETRPDFDFPVKVPDFLTQETDYVSVEAELRDVSVTWFGHSSLLLHMHDLNILIDLVFSEMISPVSFAGSRRFSSPGISVDDLPEIDILIQSHDHYDHLDYNTICAVDGKVKRYIVPLGVENHLKRWGVSSEKIQNMAWWEETSVEGLKIACTPSQHFSGRHLTDNMETLWCSWVFIDEYNKVFESGDSGDGPHWKMIHDRYGDFDFAIMECGQYNVRWPRVHSFPEQSVRAAVTLGAKTVMPVHWGAVVLSSHGWDDPVERFLLEAQKHELTVMTPYIGQTAHLNVPEHCLERWWRTKSK